MHHEKWSEVCSIVHARFFMLSGCPMLLGSRIRKAREQAHISQAELARRIGMSTTAMNAIEGGPPTRTPHVLWPSPRSLVSVPMRSYSARQPQASASTSPLCVLRVHQSSRVRGSALRSKALVEDAHALRRRPRTVAPVG
jgi:hypothetical protein